MAPASNLGNIRKGMTLVRVNARSEPTAVVLNPTDAENVDLLKENNEANNFGVPSSVSALLVCGESRSWSGYAHCRHRSRR